MAAIISWRRITFPSAFIIASSARFVSSGASSKDLLKQSKQAGKQARDNSSNPVDAASSQPKEKSRKDAPGNKEGIGMVDQVGSQSSSANKDKGNSSSSK